MTTREPARVGWREWVGAPDLTPHPIKAKVDTGALTSSLHAADVRVEERPDGLLVARFVVHPHQRSDADEVEVEAPVVDEREVRSSNAAAELRPTIRTTLRVGDLAFPALLTLTDRAGMGFRMLLGRRALRRRFVVDPGASFVQGSRPPDEDPADDADDE